MIRSASIGTVIICAVISAMGISAHGETIVNSKHNLSISGPGAVKSVSEDRICIFCHTTKATGTSATYLWNRSASAQVYTPYGSTTLYATVGQPTGASKLCLSCHDGTIALGALGSEPAEIPFAGGLRFMPDQPTRPEQWRNQRPCPAAECRTPRCNPATAVYGMPRSPRQCQRHVSGHVQHQLRIVRCMP